MSEFFATIQIHNLHLIKNAIAQATESDQEISPEQLSDYLFRRKVSAGDKEVVNAHLVTIRSHLEKILDPDNTYFKLEGLVLEYSKGISRFNELTNSIPAEGGTLADNMIIGQHFYQSARAAYIKSNVLYMGNLDISIIPIKLRLAIEVYLKNLIGFSSAKVTHAKGGRKGQTFDYHLQISKLLSFFAHEKYAMYAELPVPISILKDINVWSNSLIHSGFISYPWQSVAAVDLLKPLFKTEVDDGRWSLEGFNYLNLSFTQEQLIHDLEEHLSTDTSIVKVDCFERGRRPVEGAYFYPLTNS